MFSALILSISAVIDRAFFLRFIFKFFGCTRSSLQHVGLSLVATGGGYSS